MQASQQIVSGSTTLATYAAGSGDLVVFLHANVCDSRMWHAQMEAVAATGMAVAWDRRGFGGTRAGADDFSPVADLMAVIDAVAGGRRAILVGCSQGGKIALDAALQHPSRVRGLVLIAPTLSGAPEPVHPPEIAALLAEQRDAEAAGDLDRLGALKARLWLDGPLAPEGRVAGEARRLFLDMIGIALRSPPVGANLDLAPAYDRLDTIRAPTLVLWGDLDFPHIRERSRHVASVVPGATGHELRGTAHLPGLERPEIVTDLVRDFVGRCSPAAQ